MLSAHLLLVVFARHVRVVEGAVVAGDVADVAVVGALPVVRGLLPLRWSCRLFLDVVVAFPAG